MKSLWIGKKVRLRPERPDDADHWAASADDEELSRLAWQTLFPYDVARRRQQLEKERDKEEDLSQTDNRHLIIETLAGEIVGTIGLHAADRRHRTADLHLGLDNRQNWGKGYASEAIRLLLRFAFRELDYQKINLDVYAFNERAIRLYEHLGFQHEGRLRSNIYTEGRRWDEFVMGMTRAEYEALHNAWFPAEEQD
jgi:RimJ/RimL family protein N-acetyltransferase